jgi:hypothetical protein
MLSSAQPIQIHTAGQGAAPTIVAIPVRSMRAFLPPALQLRRHALAGEVVERQFHLGMLWQSEADDSAAIEGIGVVLAKLERFRH